MDLPTVEDVFDRHKEEILEEVCDYLRFLPRSPYQEFLLGTAEGQARLRVFLDLFCGALRGEQEVFFKDQARVGYTRALMEGFGSEVLTRAYWQVPRIVWNKVKEKAEEDGVRLPGLCEEIQVLNSILFQAYSIIMGSYLKVREERINEKVDQLQELQRFAQEVITLLEPEQLARFILSRMAALFGVGAASFCMYRDGVVQGFYHHPADEEDGSIIGIMDRAYREETVLFTGESGDVSGNIDQMPLKHSVAAPVQAYARIYGVLCLRSRGEGFRFTYNELEFLNQFLYIMALALENAFMLKEVQQAREALSQLTGKMISIQEEERRRVAADIHDTLTQALIGISYKVQLCKELGNRQPGMLEDQLQILLGKIDQAIDQSRNLISSLRPDLIDTMGLVPALERHVEGFTRETGIRVKTRLQQNLELSSRVNICLFRVAQEALMNVYKHAETDEAELGLRAENGQIRLTVSDMGKGFVLDSHVPFTGEKRQLGLLSIKERIESIGGTVRIEAATRQGCSIQVTIPRSAGHGRDGQAQGDDR